MMNFSPETAGIRDYLASTGVPFNITFTDGGAHAQGSYHYLGLAADVGSVPAASAAGLRAIYNALLPVASLTAELIYGNDQWKNGRKVAPYDFASNIWNHVHVAVPKGRILLPLHPTSPKPPLEVPVADGPAIFPVPYDIHTFAPTPSGLGYWIVLVNGAIYAFGDAKHLGTVDVRK